MLISTKGRYALRFMLDLAEHQGEGYLSLKTVATRQNISLKYLEAIANSLQTGGLVISARGKAGGYRLADEPRRIYVGSILYASQGGLNTVDCDKGAGCNCTQSCLTKALWADLNALINGFFNNLSLQHLLDSEQREIKELTLIRKENKDESICG